MSKIIFAIETSCDETACALYAVGRGLLAERIYSQWRRHAAYGGIVPEIASRDHLKRLLAMTADLLAESPSPTHIAYTRGPGLAGALLAGAATAEALAYAWRLPVIAVNHLEGHLLSPLLTAPDLSFPYTALLVSGGHSQLWRVHRRGHYERLGQTLDDAAGEAFDKSAVLLGLGYPGGARLEKLAAQGDATTVALPSPAQKRFDFSFSGLKTAVRRCLESGVAAADIAASFQSTVAAGLAKQCGTALAESGDRTLVAVGGVAQNDTIARHLQAVAERYGADFIRPALRHCGDNAAMIAVAAVHGDERPAGAFDIAPNEQPTVTNRSDSGTAARPRSP